MKPLILAILGLCATASLVTSARSEVVLQYFGTTWSEVERRIPELAERGYGAISLIDVDGMKKLLKYPPSMIFMLLADELDLPTVPENDSLGAVTQLIVRALTDQAAAYGDITISARAPALRKGGVEGRAAA